MDDTSAQRNGYVLNLVMKFHEFSRLLDQRNQGRAQRGQDPLSFDPFRGQGRVLRALERSDGTTQSELADTLAITPQTLSISLKKIVRDGLVEQERGKEDKRTNILHLTPEGHEIVDALDERARYSGSMFEALDDEELAEFDRLLSKLTEHLHREIETAAYVDELTVGTSFASADREPPSLRQA